MMDVQSDRRDGHPGGSQHSKSGDKSKNGAGGAKGQGFRIDQLLASSGRVHRGKPEPHVMHAGRVRNELARLAAERLARNGEFLPEGATAFLLARIAVIRVGRRWTIDDIRDVARIAGILMPDEGAAVKEARKAAKELRLGAVWLLPSADVLGDMFSVTAEEHRNCRMHAIGVACQTVEERRRRNDRDRKKEERAANGAASRSESKAVTKPWEAEGVSRATWYRRQAGAMQATETGSSVHNYKKDSSVDEIVSRDASRVRSSPVIDDATMSAVILELDTLVAARHKARPQRPASVMTAEATRSHLLGRAAAAFAEMSTEYVRLGRLAA